jgi:predicted DNA-binding transcriptional regulator AlpA
MPLEPRPRTSAVRVVVAHARPAEFPPLTLMGIHMLKTRAGDIIGNNIRLIWFGELCEVLGRSKWTIRRWIEQGILPRPIRITEQGVCWRVRDIEHALDRLARQRKKPKRGGALKQGSELVSR